MQKISKEDGLQREGETATHESNRDRALGETLELKCPLCGEDDQSQFGICRRRKTGHNLYCKSCIRTKVYAGRKRGKEIKEARKRAQQTTVTDCGEFERKINVIARSPVERVKRAIGDGHRTRDDIKTATGLGWDQVVNALAELAFCRKELRLIRVGDEMEFHAVAA